MIFEAFTQSGDETRKLGEFLGKMISTPLSIALSGDLGAGKTTFVQGLARGLDVPDAYYVTSPTYTIINDYPGRLPLYHLDLYRLGSPDELDYLGIDDIIARKGVIVVEWPEIIAGNSLRYDLELCFRTDRNFNRTISFSASGLESANLLQKLFASPGSTGKKAME